MRKTSIGLWVVGAGLAGLVGGFFLAGPPVRGQGSGYKGPTSPYGDGKPDLNGIYQAINTANWDLEDHPMAPGAFWQLGALGGGSPGGGVGEGGGIPYQPRA